MGESPGLASMSSIGLSDSHLLSSVWWAPADERVRGQEPLPVTRSSARVFSSELLLFDARVSALAAGCFPGWAWPPFRGGKEVARLVLPHRKLEQVRRFFRGGDSWAGCAVRSAGLEGYLGIRLPDTNHRGACHVYLMGMVLRDSWVYLLGDLAASSAL